MRSFLFDKILNKLSMKTNNMMRAEVQEQENHRNFIKKSVFISMLSCYN